MCSNFHFHWTYIHIELNKSFNYSQKLFFYFKINNFTAVFLLVSLELEIFLGNFNVKHHLVVMIKAN
jgi:hypothetical protein